MIVYVNSIGVPKVYRNKRTYTGSSVTNVSGGGGLSIGKSIIEFTDIDNPTIANYNSLYAPTYGQYPTIGLFTFDTEGNRVERTEKPYFTMVDNLIDTIVFGTLDGNYSGFITLSK